MSISTSSTWVAVNGAAGVFNQRGLISSIARPPLLAASKSSASRRSPQQIGLNPAHDFPAARKRRKSCVIVNVFPTPVSVPVTNKLTRLAAPNPRLTVRAAIRSCASLSEKPLRHPRCRVARRRRDQGAASVQTRCVPDCKCRQYFRSSRLGSLPERSPRDCPHSAGSLVDAQLDRAKFRHLQNSSLHRVPRAYAEVFPPGSHACTANPERPPAS